MIVRLNPAECRMAAQAGVERRLGAIARSSHEVYGKAAGQDYWTIDVEAVAAEIAVAKHLGLFWGPAESAAADKAAGDLPGGIQIRWTRRDNGKLILHTRDADEHRFVLVCGAMPTFRIAGAIRGRDGKIQDFWWTQAPRPAFFVPQSALEPLEP